MRQQSIKNILLMLLGAGLAVGVEEYLKRHTLIMPDASDQITKHPKKPIKPNNKDNNINLKDLTNKQSSDNKIKGMDKINHFAHSAEKAKEQKQHLVQRSASNTSLPTTSDREIKKYHQQNQKIQKLSNQIRITTHKYSSPKQSSNRYLTTILGKAYRYYAWQMIKQIDKYSNFNQMQTLAYKLTHQRNPDKYTDILTKAFQKRTPYKIQPPIKELSTLYKKVIKTRAKHIYDTYHGKLLREFNQIEHDPKVSPKDQNKLLDNFYYSVPQIRAKQKQEISSATSNKAMTANHTNNADDYMSKIDKAFSQETKKARRDRDNQSRKIVNGDNYSSRPNNLDKILGSNDHHKHNNRK